MATFQGLKISNGYRSHKPEGFYDIVKGHTGYDMICPKGTPLSIPVKSTLLFFRKTPQLGLSCYLEDDNGFVHVSSHLSSIEAKTGQILEAGEIFGKSGNSGTPPGKREGVDFYIPHWHLETIAPTPEPGGEMMTRDLSPIKGYNIDTLKYFKTMGQELNDLEWVKKHLPEVNNWDEVVIFCPALPIALRALAKRLLDPNWKK